MWLPFLALGLWICVFPNISGKTLKRATPGFDGGHAVATVHSNSVNEASGLCASRIHSDVLYTHNDSGDTHRIFAVSKSSGARLGTITINGAHANDWEDIACGPCPGGSGHCIYIADTGGNAGGDANTVYRIREPAQIRDESVNVESKLEFNWDQHDCETVMVDPNGEVYLVSKVNPGHRPKLVKLPSSAWGDNHHIYVNDGVYLTITSRSINPVGGDISPNGKEVLVKAYGHVYYWQVPDGNYYSHMQQQPAQLPYHVERQGESVCWSPHASGYYTLSEGYGQKIYYYKRTSGFELVG